jgi:hypothetical protein
MRLLVIPRILPLKRSADVVDAVAIVALPSAAGTALAFDELADKLLIGLFVALFVDDVAND